MHPAPCPARWITSRVDTNWTGTKTVWGWQAYWAAAAPDRRPTTGMFRIQAPRNGSLSGLTIQPNGAGSCSAPVCGGGGVPSTVQAGAPIGCSYTCTDDVLSVTISCTIDGFVFSSGTVGVQMIPFDGPSKCVTLTSALFKTYSSGGGGWSDRVYCTNGGALNYTTFAANPQPPGAGQCSYFDQTYDFTNTMVLNLNGPGTFVNSSDAAVTVPCPQPTFGTGANGAAAANATLVMTRNYNWCAGGGGCPGWGGWAWVLGAMQVGPARAPGVRLHAPWGRTGAAPRAACSPAAAPAPAGRRAPSWSPPSPRPDPPPLLHRTLRTIATRSVSVSQTQMIWSVGMVRTFVDSTPAPTVGRPLARGLRAAPLPPPQPSQQPLPPPPPPLTPNQQVAASGPCLCTHRLPATAPHPSPPPPQATGTFTLTSPRNGTLTSVLATGTGGTCAITNCTVGVLLVKDRTVTCAFNCTNTVTSLVPSFSVDGYVVTGANVTVVQTPVDGNTACVVMSDPLWSQAGNLVSVNATWTPTRQYCANTWVQATTKLVAPDLSQCLKCAANYTVVNTATIRTSTGNVTLGSAQATAVPPCGACTVTAVLNGTITRNWQW
jgi:hypothetical protein